MRTISLRLSKCLALLGWRALLAVISSSAARPPQHVQSMLCTWLCTRPVPELQAVPPTPETILRRSGLDKLVDVRLDIVNEEVAAVPADKLAIGAHEELF